MSQEGHAARRPPFLIRKLKGSKTSTKISKCIPSFCKAYVISKGKLSFVHSTPDACETAKTISSSTISSPSSGSLSTAPSAEWADRNGTSAVLFRQSSLPSQRDHTLVNINRSILKLALQAVLAARSLTMLIQP
ncbi:U-box domain-containing protein 51-like isoform X1 [Triticum aestivum]|uniref:U-box domain-containing protein 51-like isoform X1 n=1 Tax=Triticum aestivum TaxID=4565 RepID=UPI001D025180|nr:U-box domain-containing protein 51-like isoform X1 [Triticum aestivum]